MINIKLDNRAKNVISKTADISGGKDDPQLLEALKNFEYALTGEPSYAEIITEAVREICSYIVDDEIEGENLTEIINDAAAKLLPPMIEGVRDYIESLETPTFYPQLFKEFLISKDIDDITINLTTSSGSAASVLDNRFLDIIGYSPAPNSYKGKIVILNSEANTYERDLISSEFSLFDFLGMISNIQISLENIQWLEEPLKAIVNLFGYWDDRITITLDELKTFIKEFGDEDPE